MMEIGQWNEQLQAGSTVLEDETDQMLAERVSLARRKFNLARLAVRAAKSNYRKKRECNFWDYKRLEVLTGLIETHYKTDKAVGFYSRELNISTTTLNRLTSSVLGQTIYQLIQDRRLKEARIMLEDQRLYIKEIAYELGFGKPACFGRFFKERTGMSAREYQYQASRVKLLVKPAGRMVDGPDQDGT